MPFPKFHSGRQVDPGRFESGSFRNIDIADGITAIVGRLKGETTTTVQTYRFDREKFTVAEAKKWLKDHDKGVSNFEPASDSVQAEEQDEGTDAVTSAMFCAVIQATEKKGDVWKIVLFNAGLAHTIAGDFYVDGDVLKASVPIFEGVDVYAHQLGETSDGRPNHIHRPPGMKDPNPFYKNKVGWVKDVRVEGEGANIRMVGTFYCVDTAFRDKLANTWKVDREKMPEFSIDADLFGKNIQGVVHVKEFQKANSLDVVTKGAFGDAGFVQMVASSKTETEGMQVEELIKKILANIKAGSMKLEQSTEGKSDDEITTMIKASLGIESNQEATVQAAITADQLKAMLAMPLNEIKAAIQSLLEKEKGKEAAEQKNAQASEEQANDEGNDDDGKDSNVESRVANLERDNRLQASALTVERILAADKILDDFSKKRVRMQFENREGVTAEDVQKAMTAEKEYLDHIAANMKTPGIIKVTDAPADKKYKALECFVNPDLEGTEGYELAPGERFRDLREAVMAYAGHARFSGLQDRTPGQMTTMQAAATSDFTTVFQDVMNKQIRKQYTAAMVDDQLAKVINEISVEYLDQQHIYDIGDFGLLSDVAEAGSYTELTDASDMEATYTLKKIGNKYTVTEEMFYTSGGKVTQLVRMFPKKMVSAARCTRNAYVCDLITGCSGSTPNSQTIYDGTALYTSAHLNYASDALDYDSFYTGWTAMGNQTRLSSVFPAEVKPRWLMVPLEKGPTAVLIVSTPNYPSQTSNGVPLKNPYAGLGVEVIAIPKYYLCNDAFKWYLIADKTKNPTIQIGYFQNQRTPQIFFQNQPTVGAPFDSDEWVWKIKWRFGGAVEDFRSFYSGQATA